MCFALLGIFFLNILAFSNFAWLQIIAKWWESRQVYKLEKVQQRKTGLEHTADKVRLKDWHLAMWGGVQKKSQILLISSELKLKYGNKIKYGKCSMSSLMGKNMHHLNSWHILPQTGCKNLEIFNTQLENPKQSDLTLKAAPLPCPLWPKLLWLLNQLPLDEALSHLHAPSSHTDPTLVASWSVQAVACRLHKLPVGAGYSEPQSQICLPLKTLARSVAPGVFNKWYCSSGFSNFVFVMGSLARMVSDCPVVGYLGLKHQFLQKVYSLRSSGSSSAMVEAQESQIDFKWRGLLRRRRKRGRSRQHFTLLLHFSWQLWVPLAVLITRCFTGVTWAASVQVWRDAR